MESTTTNANGIGTEVADNMICALEGAHMVRFSLDRKFCCVWRGQASTCCWLGREINVYSVSDWLCVEVLRDSRSWESDPVRITQAMWDHMRATREG